MKSIGDLKVVPVNVYRNGGDCTNGGITAKVDQIYIIHPEGWLKASEVDPETVFEVERRGDTYWAAIPFKGAQKGLCGPMYGGNLVATTDGRLPMVLHVHDRYETPELAQMLAD
jgi:hypothetical protein